MKTLLEDQIEFVDAGSALNVSITELYQSTLGTVLKSYKPVASVYRTMDPLGFQTKMLLPIFRTLDIREFYKHLSRNYAPNTP